MAVMSRDFVREGTLKRLFTFKLPVPAPVFAPKIPLHEVDHGSTIRNVETGSVTLFCPCGPGIQPFPRMPFVAKLITLVLHLL
jgi:hypothetical protein